MRKIVPWLRRKYLMRILISVTLISVLFVVASTWVVYYYSQKIVLSVQEDANLKTINQIQFNIDSMNQAFKEITNNVFFDSATIYMMNTQKINWSEMYLKVDRLNQFVTSSPFLESITIYNAKLDCYISTSYTGSCQSDGAGGTLSDYLSSHSFTPPKLKLVPIQTMDRGNTRVDRFSYFLAAPMPNQSKPSILIMNIKPEWMTDNLHHLHRVDASLTDNLLILDHNGIVLQSAPNDEIQGSLLVHKISSGEPGNQHFIDNIGGKKSIVTYVQSAVNDWYIASIQDYNVIYQNTAKLRLLFVMLLTLFICLSVIVSVWVTRRLYKPVQLMLTDLTNNDPSLTPDKDEFASIRNRYALTLQNLQMLRKDYDGRVRSGKSFYLRKWLMDSHSMDLQEMKCLFDNKQADEEEHISEYVVCLLKMDNYRHYEKNVRVEEKQLHRFAICNISQEMIGRSFPNEVVDKGDHYAIIVCIQDVSSNWYEKLQQLLQEVQAVIQSYYRLSLTAGLMSTTTTVEHVTAAYTKVQDIMNYRFVVGKASLLTQDLLIDPSETVNIELQLELEKKLSESIKISNIEGIRDHLSSIAKEVASMPYHQIVHRILRVVSVIVNTVMEINANRVVQIPLDVKRFYDLVLEQETLQETFEVLEGILTETCAMRREDKQEQKNHLLVDTIKEMIETHLDDLNLGIAFIADNLHMSSVQTNKIFKEKTGLAIHEYVHEVRLEKARMLLESGSYSVNEIMQLVGFGNQSYFFRLFKKKFGVTPRELRLKSILSDQ